jgi:hypothetical protein
MAGRSFVVSFICACLLVCAPAARDECSPQAAASCAGADLKSRDLQGIDLSSDNFVKADLSRANSAGRSCKAPAWPAQTRRCHSHERGPLRRRPSCRDGHRWRARLHWQSDRRIRCAGCRHRRDAVQFKTSSSVNSTAITYTHKGRRFVSVASGLGGAVISRFAPSQVPAAGTLRTFALMAE